TGAFLGNSVAGVGDVDGDGFADALVAGDDYAQNGRGYAFRGSPLGLARAAGYARGRLHAGSIGPPGRDIGATWSAPLALGHAHGTGGALLLKIRGATVNGANFSSPFGGRLTEVLVSGPLLAAVSGTHNGAAGDIPLQTVPNQVSLVGLPW